MSFFSQARLYTTLLWSFLRLVRNPLVDLGPVFKLSSGVADPEYLTLVEKFLARSPIATRALYVQPRLGKISIGDLLRHPPGSLGRSLGEFLVRNHLDPAALPANTTNDRMEYLVAHIYETHDLWHVLFGFGPDVAGEMGLQAVYASQLPGKLPPLLMAAVLLNTVFFAFDDAHRRLDAIAYGWRMGSQAETLFGIPWSELWGRPLEELRTQFRIEGALANPYQ